MRDHRNHIFDAIKALAIFLVVYAHCYVYIGDYDFWTNPIFQFIYTFHMPLFFMISGFFFVSSLRLGWKDFLIKKSIALLLPCFVWTIIFTCMHFNGWSDLFLKLRNPFGWKLWFLRGLFLVQLIAYICIKIGYYISQSNKKAIIFAILISSAVYFLPFMSVPRVMMPMFWIGYLIYLNYDNFIKYHFYIALGAFLGFIALFPLWTSDIQEMYGGAKVKIFEVVLGNADPLLLLKLVYRILIGVCGSVAIIAACHSIKSIPRSISIVGGATAAIYILQSLLLEDLIGTYFAPYAYYVTEIPQWVVFAILFPIISLIIIFCCVILRKLIYTNRYVSAVLLGDNRIYLT